MEAVGEWGGLELSRNKGLQDIGPGYTWFEDDDVVVAKITPCFENGKGAFATGLTNGAALGTTELHVVRAGPSLDPKFLFYATISHTFRCLGEASMYGAGGQKRIPDSYVKDFRIALPATRAEQREIVTFLERETARIDALIEHKQLLVRLLAERRNAIVERAVSRGLSPHVPIRESTVPWLGATPAHWKTVPLKFAAAEVVDCKNRTPEYHEGGQVGVLRTSNVRGGQFLEVGLLLTDEEGYAAWTQRGEPRAGDVVFTREAPAGEACIIPADRPYCLGQRTMLIRAGRMLPHANFIVHSVYGPQVRGFMASTERGSTVSHLRVGEVRGLPFLVPPPSEQQSIGAFLDAEETRWRAATEAQNRSIELLREQRRAVITAAVTGQIDVRAAVAASEVV